MYKKKTCYFFLLTLDKGTAKRFNTWFGDYVDFSESLS